MPGIEDIIRARHSCRSYSERPLSDDDRMALSELAARKMTGPFGGEARFILVAAGSSDGGELKGLGTYGFIRNPAAFIIGVLDKKNMNLEDFGYLAESIILRATEMGLGTCWLGGSFSKSSFAARSGISADEIIPAVVAAGYAADKKTLTDRIIRRTAGSDNRKQRGEIFFGSDLSPLHIDFETGFGAAMEMVRLAPSASNKQPWRIIRESDSRFHFFMERTPGYYKKNSAVVNADLQRVDMGIAMCHFELFAKEKNLKGRWINEPPSGINIPAAWEYTITCDGK